MNFLFFTHPEFLCLLQVLFPNDAVVMILARIIGMFGSIDMEMLVKGQDTHKYFTKEYDIYYVNEVCFLFIAIPFLSDLSFM